MIYRTIEYRFTYQCSNKVKRQLKQCAKRNMFNLNDDDGGVWPTFYHDIDTLRANFPDLSIEIDDKSSTTPRHINITFTQS